MKFIHSSSKYQMLQTAGQCPQIHLWEAKPNRIDLGGEVMRVESSNGIRLLYSFFLYVRTAQGKSHMKSMTKSLPGLIRWFPSLQLLVSRNMRNQSVLFLSQTAEIQIYRSSQIDSGCRILYWSRGCVQQLEEQKGTVLAVAV